MDSVRVPLTINIGLERYNVGVAIIEPDGSLTTHISSSLSEKLKDLVWKAYQISPASDNGRIERAVRLQGARYGLQIRGVEEQSLWDDRIRLRRAYHAFREQLADTPHLQVTARDAYWSTYGGIAYNLYCSNWYS